MATINYPSFDAVFSKSGAKYHRKTPADNVVQVWVIENNNGTVHTHIAQDESPENVLALTDQRLNNSTLVEDIY